jgi:REP element-mobilizing transposase RayT
MFQKFYPLWFLTATNYKWLKLIESDDFKSILEQSLTHLVTQNRCSIYAFVFMPNHIHLILDVHEKAINNFQRDFLKYTAQRCILKMKDLQSNLLAQIESTQKDRIYQFWERRPMWVEIRNEYKWYEKLAYIHDNPVKSSKVRCNSTFDYKWSSANSYRDGVSYFDFLKLLQMDDD